MSTKEELLQAALGRPHAHLIFEDCQGRVRDFTVEKIGGKSLQAESDMGTARPGAESWSMEVAVTNDMSILEYFISEKTPIPSFPAVQDWKDSIFDDLNTVRVGIINAGGPASGLNVVNDMLTKRHFKAWQGTPPLPVIYGYRGGFEGVATNEKYRLIPTWQMSDEAKVHLLKEMANDPGIVGVLATDSRALEAGTFLNTSRFNLADKEKDPKTGETNLDKVVKRIFRDRLHILQVIGGNGTLAGAQKIKDTYQEYVENGHLSEYPDAAKELIVMGGPKTMDNDLLYADVTFGYTTTVDQLVKAIRTFHTTVACQDRIGVMEVFGAASGFVALQAMYASGEADYFILPEDVERKGLEILFAGRPAQFEQCIRDARFLGLNAALERHLPGSTVEDLYAKGLMPTLEGAAEEIKKRLPANRHVLIVIAQGAKGEFKHGDKKEPIMSLDAIIKFFYERFKPVLVTCMEPTYLIRDVSPHSYDIDLCKVIGKAMADAALAGYTNCMVTRWCGQHVLVPLRLATHHVRRVDPDEYYYQMVVQKYRLDFRYQSAGRLQSLPLELLGQ